MCAARAHTSTCVSGHAGDCYATSHMQRFHDHCGHKPLYIAYMVIIVPAVLSSVYSMYANLVLKSRHQAFRGSHCFLSASGCSTCRYKNYDLLRKQISQRNRRETERVATLESLHSLKGNSTDLNMLFMRFKLGNKRLRSSAPQHHHFFICV